MPNTDLVMSTFVCVEKEEFYVTQLQVLSGVNVDTSKNKLDNKIRLTKNMKIIRDLIYVYQQKLYIEQT